MLVLISYHVSSPTILLHINASNLESSLKVWGRVYDFLTRTVDFSLGSNANLFQAMTCLETIMG